MTSIEIGSLEDNNAIAILQELYIAALGPVVGVGTEEEVEAQFGDGGARDEENKSWGKKRLQVMMGITADLADDVFRWRRWVW